MTHFDNLDKTFCDNVLTSAHNMYSKMLSASKSMTISQQISVINTRGTRKNYTSYVMDK